jgi:predicted membrane protein
MVKKVMGLFVIVVGILVLLSNFDLIDFDNMAGAVFSLGIFAIGAAGLIEKKQFDIVLSAFVVIGGLYFIANLGFIDEDVIGLIVGPLLIVAVGLSLFFSIGKRIVDDKDKANYIAIFGGVECKNQSNNYVSSEITAIFGGADIDYRKIKFKDKKAYINVTAIFGGATIILPEDIKVTVKGLPLFGGAENKAVSNPESKNEMIINYTAVFGGVEIKN